MIVQKISALFRRITLKHDGDFYCLNCLYSFRTKNKLESHKTECENKYLCGAIISYEDTKILELNQFQKSDETLSIIYIGLESLIQKVGGCKNKQTYFLRIFNVYDMDLWWRRKKSRCIQRWGRSKWRSFVNTEESTQ